jgi:hypothetical protein
MTYRVEWVCCGRCKKACMHGPYWYGYWKEDGKLHKKYLGKAGPFVSPDRPGRSGTDDDIFRKATASPALAMRILNVTLEPEEKRLKEIFRHQLSLLDEDSGDDKLRIAHVSAAYTFLKAWLQGKKLPKNVPLRKCGRSNSE